MSSATAGVPRLVSAGVAVALGVALPVAALRAATCPPTPTSGDAPARGDAADPGRFTVLPTSTGLGDTAAPGAGPGFVTATAQDIVRVAASSALLPHTSVARTARAVTPAGTGRHAATSSSPAHRPTEVEPAPDAAPAASPSTPVDTTATSGSASHDTSEAGSGDAVPASRDAAELPRWQPPTVADLDAAVTDPAPSGELD